MRLRPLRAVEMDEEHFDHIATWVAFKCQQAFEEKLASVLSEAEDGLRAGMLVDWPGVQKAIDDAADEVDFEELRHWYLIKIECPPIVETIIGEAWDLARAGETAEALHRLSLLTRPKWPSEAACRDEYTVVMAESLARTIAAERARRRTTARPFADTPLGATFL